MDKSDKIKIARLIIALLLFITEFTLIKTGVIKNAEWYVTLVIYIVPYLVAGYDVVMEALENILHFELFDEAFLMMLASIGAFVIGEYEEAVAVMVFYQIGEFLSDLAVDRSRESIEALMDISPAMANLYDEGEIKQVACEDVKISDVIVVRAGERIPLDGTIIDGISYLDTSALTGESVRRRVGVGDEVLSGCLNGDNTLRLSVTKTYENSTVTRILEMVENSSEKKSQTENFITRFAGIYTPVVTILAVLIAVLPPLILGGGFGEWIRRACTFLVISCPCALVISVPLAFFAGIGAASSQGILIKGGNYLEMLSDLSIVAFDKTGTITEGKFTVRDVLIYGKDDVLTDGTKESVLRVAAALEQFSDHPIAESIVKAYRDLEDTYSYDYKVTDATEIAGCGISGLINGRPVGFGNGRLLEQNNIDDKELLERFKNEYGTVSHLIIDGQLIASVIVGDEIRSSSRDAIKALKEQGIEKCVMLTGDRGDYAAKVADTVGLDEYMAELLPADKIDAVERLIASLNSGDRKAKSYVAYAGDGINDAPSIMRADVGIAMGIGSDAAIEAADIVLAENNLGQISRAIKISRKTMRIARENIIFALTIKSAVLILGAFGMVSMWLAVFADVGVALIAVLNAMRIGRTGR